MEHTDWIERHRLDDLRRLQDPSQLIIQLGITSYDDGAVEERLYKYVDGQWLSELIDQFENEH